MKESLKKFLSKHKTNGLFVLEMPTGSGKTFNVTKFIQDFLAGKHDDLEIPRIFYITPQRKNLNSLIVN